MRNTVWLKLECARGVVAFCRLYPGSAPAAQEAEQRLERLMAQCATLMDQEWVAQDAAATAARTRDELAKSLKERIDLFLPIAATVWREKGIKELRLRVPYRVAYPGRFVRAVRHAIDTATTHQPLLVKYGMPSQMLEALRAGLDTLQAAHDRRATSAAVYSATTADLANLAGQAMPVVKHLDALNRIRFLAAPDRLKEWKRVSTITWGRAADGAAPENVA